MVSGDGQTDASDPQEVDAEVSRSPIALQDQGLGRLPAVYCRHCGRAGWAAISPESSPEELVTAPRQIRQASISSDKKRVRTLIAATGSEAASTLQTSDSGSRASNLLVLEGSGGRLRPANPAEDFDADRRPALADGVFVLVDLIGEPADRGSAADRCPACATDYGIRYLGAGLATLASASITQLFTGGGLDPEHRKTLMFSDSVQDAAHRAGFVAARSFGFSLRSLLAKQLRTDEARALNDVIADLIDDAAESGILAAVVPPDLRDRPGMAELLADPGRADVPEALWTLVAERLAFQVIMDFGLRSRAGRTLELTRTAAAEVAMDDPDRIATLARDIFSEVMRGRAIEAVAPTPDADRFEAYVRGLLERLRQRGAVKHVWLEEYLNQAGVRRWLIWGGRPGGMPAFPKGLSAPTFLLDKRKERSGFDTATANGGWYQDWTMRCLGLDRELSTRYLPRLLEVLASEAVVSSRLAQDGATRIYGLLPAHIRARLLAEAEVNDAAVECDTCSWQQTVLPERAAAWRGHPCPRFHCTGTLREPDLTRDYRKDYYRTLYLGSDVVRIVTAEHTGQLTRKQREEVERDFRDGTRFDDPNVLSCTPTLELGIDIGDLSTVVLASLPSGPANYVQRVGRAGRSTGNAFLLTVADNRPRSLYYLAEPREMIAGEIVPPGAYLSAVEILRRQYAAHLIDLCARGRLPGVRSMPRRASVLFGPSGWLADFATAAIRDGAVLVEEFLALFAVPAEPAAADQPPSMVDPAAADQLRAYATGGIAGMVDTLQELWENRLADLRDRLAAIEAAAGEQAESVEDQAAVARELRAEHRAVGRWIGELGRATAHSTLVELGLLPNYSLVDTPTSLEALLIGVKTNPDGSVDYDSELREYERSAWIALTDLAPGNTFYVNGYKHRVTGLDIGSRNRPTYRNWRVCPECGHCRTARAVEDTSPCPRCGQAAIGDQGCLYRVLVPRRVTSRDKRDDAVIDDGSEQRDRKTYAVAAAVEVEPGRIARSWRHTSATFGVDFGRDVVIRRFNLGPARFDNSPEKPFAGEEVRLSPFLTCTACGGVALDGLGAADPNSDGMTNSGARSPATAHHRPWCPRRRSVAAADHVPLILVHELTTEALRILLPAVTTLVKTRLVSFKALLHAGISAYYGGDPSHLAVEYATMPDTETGENKRFVVLYDTLPGGTGYLHRLADPEKFAEVLLAARRVIENCVCTTAHRPVCHRCLLRFVRSEEYPDVSRDQARSILFDLLGDQGEAWSTDDVERADLISLSGQVESELEQRFVNELITWGRNPESPGSVTEGPWDVSGNRTIDLRITAPDQTRVTHWAVRLQRRMGGVRPDIVFKRLDAAPMDVTVFLDGYRWHASATNNDIAEDADKRATLRADGKLVFQITWNDIERWADVSATVRAAADWPPYQGNAQAAAGSAYARASGNQARELETTAWANPVAMLLAFLAEPDLDRWRMRAEATLTGMLALNATGQTTVDGARIGEAVASSVRGEELPVSTAGAKVTVRRVEDANALPLTIAVDQRSDTAWTALAVLDDSPETISRDEAAHKRRWASWLAWGSLIQFLDHGNGDGRQLAASTLSSFDVAELAVAAVDVQKLHEPRPEWTALLVDLDHDEPELSALVRGLADRGLALPYAGFELGDARWQAEFAWEDARIAIVLSVRDRELDADEYRRRDEAFRAAGWTVRPATDWTVGELEALIRGSVAR